MSIPLAKTTEVLQAQEGKGDESQVDEKKEQIRKMFRERALMKVDRMTFLLEYVGEEILRLADKGLLCLI